MYLAKDRNGYRRLFGIKPIWKEDLGIWIGGDCLIFDEYLPVDFPPVKRGECVKVKLELDE